MTDTDGKPELAVDDAAPPEAAANADDYLAAKIGTPAGTVLVLASLAGAYIGFGSILFLIVGAGGSEGFSGIQTLLSGIAFSVGLALVVVAGAELFTGDTLLVVKRVDGTVGTGALLRFWGLVYAGNLVGSLGVAVLFVLAGGHLAGDGAVGLNALDVGATKAGKSVVELFASGILANALVCLAVWMTQAARTVPGKILALLGPVTAFVAAGFEHSVANMSILPIGLIVQALAGPDFYQIAGGSRAEFADLALGGATLNIAVSTLGNIVGGAAVGLAYWYAYLRKA